MALKLCLILLFAFGSVSAQVNVRLVTDEAEAVLNVLAKRKANQAQPHIQETDRNVVQVSGRFNSLGY